ncbi:MAG: purine-binding chemotaxis protein CheW [Gemmatimonadetes bacterium]|nr:purine-binding chemotaxis protein CheW [Gemmatimonadota bacterium]
MLDQAPARVVVFRVAGQFYAIDVMVIERVIRHLVPRPIPMGSDEFTGVIDVEGRLVPVVDLRDRFGGDQTPRADTARVLLVRESSGLMGFVVDQVLEVRSVEATDVEPAPAALHRGEGSLVFLGTLRRSGDVVLLVDAAALLAATRTPAASVS